MRIRVPATSANLGPGFDTLGMALQFYNHFEAHPAEALSVVCSPHTCVETEGMSLDPQENLLAVAYRYYFTQRGEPIPPVQLVIEAHIPLSRGLGSSSSAIVAGLMLADSQHPNPLGKTALLPWTIALEEHPDNVVPALMGGVHCCLDDIGTSIRLTWPTAWGILMVVPPQPVSTHEARSVMPSHYSVAEAVSNLRGTAAWLHAVTHGDAPLFRQALHSDCLHQPARSRLIPEFTQVQHRIAGTDALGCVISGSGSTLAVFTPHPQAHQALRTHLQQAPELAHCKLLSLQPDEGGATMVASRTESSAAT